MLQKKHVWQILLLLAVGILPFLIRSNYVLYVINLIGIYSICVVSLNLLTGIGGQTSVGNAAFIAIGAYTSALLNLRLGTPFLLAVILSGLFTAVIGFIIGLPAVRLSGHYLAVATLGFGVAVPAIALKWESLTQGFTGLSPSKPSIGAFVFDSEIKIYYLIAVFLLIIIWIMKNLINSRFGRRFIAIRDSEIAAQAMGVHLPTNKAFLFAISAFFTGIAGSIYCHSIGYISPNDFTIDVSFNLISMVVIGGLTSLGGSVLGAALIIIVGQLTNQLQGYSLVITGIIVILVILYFPNGISGVKDLKIFTSMKSRFQNILSIKR